MAGKKPSTTKHAEDGSPLPTRKEFYKRFIGSDLSAAQIQKRVDAQISQGGFSDPLPPGPPPEVCLPPDAQKNPGVGGGFKKFVGGGSPGASKSGFSTNAKPSPKQAPKPKVEEEQAETMNLPGTDLSLPPWMPKAPSKPAATPQAQLDHYHKQFGGLPREEFGKYVAAEAARIAKAGGWEVVKDDMGFLGEAGGLVHG